MTIKLLFGHGGKNGFDDCWIDVIHDLLRKRGNVFTAPVGHSFFLSLPQKETKRSSAGKI